jgi:hypothetical protein
VKLSELDPALQSAFMCCIDYASQYGLTADDVTRLWHLGIAGEMSERVARLDAAMEASIARFMSPDQSDLHPELVQATAELLNVVKLPQ